MNFYNTKSVPIGRILPVEKITPVLAYLRRTPAVQAPLKKHGTLKPTKQLVMLLVKAKVLIEGCAPHYADAVNLSNVVADPAVPYLPGCLILAHMPPKSGTPENVLIEQLEIWDVTEGNLESQLHKRLQDANEAYAPAGPDRWNVALWITGTFTSATPLHAIVVDVQGAGLSFLSDGTALHPVHRDILSAAVSHLRTIFNDLGSSGGADSGGTPTQANRNFAAMQYGFTRLLDTQKLLAASKKSRENDARAFKTELYRERETLMAEANARRRGALAAKNHQIEATGLRVRDLERELVSAKRGFEGKLSLLRQEFQAAPATVSAGDHTPSAPAKPRPLVEIPDEAAEHIRHTVNHQAEVIRQLRLSQRHLSEELAAAKGAGTKPPAAHRRLADLPDWAAENADRVIVLKRAIHAAKKSTFGDERFFYATLDMLATTYRDVKLNLQDRMAFRKACDKLGLDYGGSIAECVPDEYYFDWKGRRTFLDQHIGRGVSRDPRYCFRAYFTWDAEESKVIVGWLPGHLPTRTT